MTALQTMTNVSGKRWFIALYRWAIIALIPFFTGIGSWVLLTTYNSQIAIAQLNEQIVGVNTSLTVASGRIDSLEEASTAAISARNIADVNLASRLTKLETSNDNLTKAIDRLVKLLDDNPRRQQQP